VETFRAKLFRNGGSQAVRLPKSVRFPEEEREVLVRRSGNAVVLEPLDAWPEQFRACLGAWPHEFEQPRQAPLARLRRRR
jgi:antitoxin VapB